MAVASSQSRADRDAERKGRHRGMACRGAVEDVTKYGGLAYSVEREFACPIDRMWHAWTDPIALESWYHPTTMSCVPGSVTSHAVVGGQWSTGIDVTEFGFHAYFYGWYTDVERNRLLAHTMSYTQDPEAFALLDRDAPAHLDRKSTRLNSSHSQQSRMPSSA